MRNIDNNYDKTANENELDRLYQIYLKVQSGNKSALDELFKEVKNKQICRADEINKEYQISCMDNVLDSELVLDNEKNKQEKEWIDSAYSNVAFRFPCLNKMLYKKKKSFLVTAKNTGYENGKKIKNSRHSKFYEGEYDISDFNELMYEAIIEIFNEKTDASNCLTLDGKKNEKCPICDGVSLLRNISYFTSRKINKRAKNSYLDILDMEYYNEEEKTEPSGFDKYAIKKFLESEGGISRLAIYAEYLEWLQRYDIYRLFKSTSCNIKAIIETIMNFEDTFITDAVGNMEDGFGMRMVTQEMLRKIIKSRHSINIEQGNISKNLEVIEQRLLDHLFYSLNYRIGKAEESQGIYEKESERFLCEVGEKKYIKVFSRTSHIIYDKSIKFINSKINSNDFDSYFRTVKKYEDMVIDIVTLEKGKKKYDMVNLIFENDDLVDDKREALLNVAKTVISYYQKKEDEFKDNELSGYKLSRIANRGQGYWEAELQGEFMNVKLWSRREAKKPIRHCINKDKLMVYCGYMDFYFCNIENKVCYRVPKDRRIISKANKNHEIFMYDVS